MKRFPTGFKCISASETCPWFTVGKVYTPIYRDTGVYLDDDGCGQAALDWKLTNLQTDDQWSIQICDHYPRTIATFTEVHAEGE